MWLISACIRAACSRDAGAPPSNARRVPPAADCPQVRWITFHSGYDFGYLLKLLTCASLPAHEGEFFELLKASGEGGG